MLSFRKKTDTVLCLTERRPKVVLIYILKKNQTILFHSTLLSLEKKRKLGVTFFEVNNSVFKINEASITFSIYKPRH